MLILKIYNMINNINIIIAIKITLQMIINQLILPTILIIIYINLYLLYECLVKLRMIKKKHLIINIITLQQSYKCHELFKI